MYTNYNLILIWIYCFNIFYLINSSGHDIGERIDIHTQTQRKAQSANAYLSEHQNQSGPENDDNEDLNEDIMTQDDDDESGANGGGLYQHKADMDMEWKTQSLPSLGRVSTEQSMESSGDEFAALRRTAPTRMIKSRNVSNNCILNWRILFLR